MLTHQGLAILCVTGQRVSVCSPVCACFSLHLKSEQLGVISSHRVPLNPTLPLSPLSLRKPQVQ